MDVLCHTYLFPARGRKRVALVVVVLKLVVSHLPFPRKGTETLETQTENL